MTARIAVIGDPMEPLASILADLAPPGDGGDESATCLVGIVDATESFTPRAARRHLRDRFHDLLREAETHPALRQVVVLHAHSPEVPADRIRAAAEGLASKLHAELERACARYVDAILVDVTECDDAAVLAARIREAAAARVGAGEAALTWDEVRHQPIREAAVSEHC